MKPIKIAAEAYSKPRSSGRESAPFSGKLERTYVRCYSLKGSPAVLVFAFGLMFAVTQHAAAQSTNADFQQAVKAYQQSPTPATVEKVIKLTATLDQLPPIPDAARKYFVRGTALIKDAKTPEDSAQAGDEFLQAASLAPWWPEARYNAASAFAAAGEYSKAIVNLKLYQLFKLSETEARSVQDKIWALEAKQEKAAKDKELAAKKAAEEGRAEREAAAGKAAEETRPKGPDVSGKWDKVTRDKDDDAFWRQYQHVEFEVREGQLVFTSVQDKYYKSKFGPSHDGKPGERHEQWAATLDGNRFSGYENARGRFKGEIRGDTIVINFDQGADRYVRRRQP